MQVITKDADPAFFRFISDGNLVRQYDMLKSFVEGAIRHADCPVSEHTIRSLNLCAVTQLSPAPGEYRVEPVSIRNSPHSPPPHDQVPPMMRTFVTELHARWEKSTASHLAALALWKLCWVHPFLEGNGRTARAICYLILCVKHKIWLPGANTIPEQIRSDRTPYYSALRDADRSYDPRRPEFLDLSSMERYLDGLLLKQLSP